MTTVFRIFPEDQLVGMLQDKIFEKSAYLDSCVVGYVDSAMIIIILFIHVQTINSVPKFARRNSSMLNPEMRYIYSYMVRTLVNC